jgi:hypothetical protein
MSDRHLEDSSDSSAPQEEPIKWDSLGVGVPVELVPRIRALARRRGLSVSALGRTLFIAALESDRAA